MPDFFVPFTDPDKYEEAYVELASACGRSALPAGDRIHSITFRHDGVEWVATVGEALRGTETVRRKIRGKRVEQTVPRYDGSTVLAIFPPAPFLVWHDNSSRRWVNPFMAGEPRTVAKF